MGTENVADVATPKEGDMQSEWERIWEWETVEWGTHKVARWMGQGRKRIEVFGSAFDHVMQVRHVVTGEHALLVMPYDVRVDDLNTACTVNGWQWEELPCSGWWHEATHSVLIRLAT